MAALAAFAGLLSGPAAGAASPRPTFVVAPASGGVGDVVQTTFDHWPAGLATIAVCGNGAPGSTAGCDLRSAYTVNVPAGGFALAWVVLLQPPAPCPCVVRVWTSDGSVTRNAPVDIAGVPVAPAPPVPATSTSADGISVDVRVHDRSSAWSAAVGLPLSAELEVTVRNSGQSATPALHLGGGVGRSRGGGDPFPTRTIGPIAPGTARMLRIPVDISGPSWGNYVVYGTLFGLDRQLQFERKTSGDPWALELAIPVLILLYAAGGPAARASSARRSRGRRGVGTGGRPDRGHVPGTFTGCWRSGRGSLRVASVRSRPMHPRECAVDRAVRRSR